MKKIYLCISFCFLFYCLTAQTAAWTWVSGDNTFNIPGVYGTKGIPGSENKPGSRSGSVSWKDKADNLWLFGGYGYGATKKLGYLNDLWLYNTSANEWTWISGDDFPGQDGVYGTKGIPGLENKPGSRENSISWIDDKGNLWLFGGFGHARKDIDGFLPGYLNDLWVYSPRRNEWTWISGDDFPNAHGVYGTKGQPTLENKPGSRGNSISWIDASDNLWLFGGFGNDFTSKQSYLNDLWKYNKKSNEWTWVSGDNTIEHQGVYGIKGQPASENKPGSRKGSVSWKDGADNLWLFGGYGFDSQKGGYLNDLWQYIPTSNEWIWVSGDNTAQKHGVYGTKGVPALANVPGSRSGSISWKDAADNLWLFGGYGFDAESKYEGSLNDLWQYNVKMNEWAWVSGDHIIDQQGVYGTKGTPALENKPGSRYGSVSWIDASDNLWLFGGAYYIGDETTVYHNDLWKFNQTTLSCPNAVTVSTDVQTCSQVVVNIDPIISPENSEAIVSYSITGATTDNGLGSVSGKTFFKGVSTVVYHLEKNTAQSCTFTVTVADRTPPVPSVADLPDITGECSVTVTTVPAATDNCSGTITAITNDPLKYSDEGTYVITWNYTDSSGNITTQDQKVIVTHGSGKPVPDTADLPDIVGECSATVITRPTATLNCGGTIEGTTNDPLSYNKQGTYIITWTYNNDGNGATQQQRVIVKDNTAPVPATKNLPDITGECSVAVSNMPIATDNCSGTITAVTTDLLSYSTQGIHIITWKYDDGNGNMIEQTQKVIVKDITPPVPTTSKLPDIIGECSATVINMPTAIDNCSETITAITADPLSYSTKGIHIITWKYDDGNGNNSEQTQKVIVKDITAPVPAITNLPDITRECSVTVTTMPTATDNCSGAITATTHDPLKYSEEGIYVITWTYTDGSGNMTTQNQNVIVTKGSGTPVPDVPNLPDITGECSAAVTARPTATLNCGGTIEGTTNDPLSYDKQGTYIITWTYENNGNVTTTQQQRVIIKDNIAPVPTVKNLPDITGECSATVINTPAATDNCSGTITATTTDPLLYKTQGVHVITWKYDDGNGNITEQKQNLIVKDVTAPIPTVKNLPDITGECLVTVTTKPAATDNCSETITGATTDPLLYKTAGTHTISWKYDDGNGNITEQKQNVIIKDNTPPVPTIANLPDITGECSVTVTTMPTATDNCSGTLTATTKNSLVYAGEGTHVITWTYSDNSGNKTTQKQNVIVTKSSGKPVPDIANLPDITGECLAAVTARPTATLNCLGTIEGTTTDPLTYNKQGTYIITWTYNNNGNVAAQQQRVIIKDNTAPVPTLKNLPDITGECSATVINTPTATDNCSGTVTAITTDFLTFKASGVYTITWKYDDGNGNISEQKQKVIIKDITAPVPSIVNLPDITGACSVTVTTKPTATDNCFETVTATTNNSLVYSAEGRHVITWTYTDGSGNITAQNQNVIVTKGSGTPVPDVASLPDITGECSATVTAPPTATLNCGGTIKATTTDPLTYNKQGTYTITWTYNTSGNVTTTQQQRVIIKDITPPVPTIATLPDITGDCSVSITTRPKAIDGCTGAVTATTTGPLVYTTPGSYTITWSFNDGNGNVTEQKQNVIVKSIIFSIKVFPNPTNNQFKIIVKSCNKNEEIRMQVFDIFGRQMKLEKGPIINVDNPVEFGNSYPAAPYFVQIIHGKERVILKLLKQ